MIKKLFTNTAIYGLAPQITKIASFFALPLITRDLTALDYGVSGVLGAFTSAISIFAGLGLKLVLVNSFYKSPGHYRWLWRQVYGFLSLWTIVYALVLALLIYWAVPEAALDNKWTIIALNVIPLVFFGQTQSICSTYYQLNQRPIPIAVRSVVFGFMTVLLNVYFISILKMGYMGWFWSGFIVGVLNNISYYYPLNFLLKITPIFNYKWRLIKQSLRVSLPMVPHFYSSYLLNSSDKMVMDLLHVNTSSIGKYNVAYTVGKFVESLGIASGLAIGPMLNKLYKEKKDQAARNLVSILQLVFFCVTVALSLWMKEAFTFLIRNQELAAMYPLGIIIVMAYNYRPMYFGANAKLMYAEKTNLLWRVTLMAGVINVVLNLICIPLFGFSAAAFTTFIALMYMGYAGFFMKVFKEINTANYYPVVWILLTIGLTCLVYWAVEFNVVVKVLLTLVFLGVSILMVFNYRKQLYKI